MAFIGLDRGIENHWIYQDPEYFKVWFNILLRARFSTEPERKLWEGALVTVEYGQFVFGRISWSNRLNVSEQRLRTLFKKLTDDEMIELVQKYPKFSLYQVKNYAKYNQQNNHQQTLMGQGLAGIYNQHSNNEPTSSQPAANQQPTTQEQCKQGKQQSKDSCPKPKNQVYDEDSTPYKMSKYLHEKIMEYAEEIKVAHLVKGADLQKWADDCRKLLDLDKRDKQEAFKIIEFVRKDEFWRTVILSPANLRKKYVELAVKMHSSNSIHNPVPKYSSPPKEKEVEMYVRPSS